MIIILCPFSDGGSGMIEAEKQAFVEQFVTHSSVEGFDVAVLHRLSRRDVVPFDLVLL